MHSGLGVRSHLFYVWSLIICGFAVIVQLSQKETGSLRCRNLTDDVMDLLKWRSLYPEHPVFEEDLLQLIAITKYWTGHCLTASPLPSNHLFHLWSIADLLVNETNVFWNAPIFSRRVFSASIQYSFCSLLINYFATVYTGWRKKNVPNFRMALCNRVIKINKLKNTCLMSKHIRISLGIFA